MATLRDIKRRITSVKKTQQITKAMKMVAAAKLRKAQERINQTRPYAESLGDVLARVAANVDSDLNPYLKKPETVESVCLVVITSDRGLCGSFNTNIIRTARQEADRLRAEGKTVKIVAVGRKGYEYFHRRDFDVVAKYINIFRDLNYEHAKEIARLVVRAYLEGEYDQVNLIFTAAVSAIKADLHNMVYLPLSAGHSDEQQHDTDYLFEPEPEVLLRELCPKNLNIQMWRALLDSYAAEESARMVAMESATDNAQEMIDGLTLHYNKVRQAAITTEISEIVGGAEALK